MNALLHSYLDMPNEHFIGFCLIISNSECFNTFQVHMSDIIDASEQERVILETKKNVTQKFPSYPLSDAKILRFCRAQKFSVDEATLMLSNFIVCWI